MSLDLNLPKEKDMSKPLTRGELMREFEDFLNSNGLQVDKKGLVTDGSIGRAYITDGSGAKLVGWYQVWFDQSIPFGAATTGSVTTIRSPLGNQIMKYTVSLPTRTGSR